MRTAILTLCIATACGTPVEPVCGNGTIEEGEGCDDGNTVHYDACDRTCQIPDCLVTWYHDLDEDGVGGDEAERSCNGRNGLVENTGDCDDEDASVKSPRLWYMDADNDGLGDATRSETACEPPPNSVTNALDTNDAQSDISGCWVDVGAGRNHSCAVTAGGEIRCWGDPEGGRTDAPTGNDFASLTAGYTHTCALRRNGRAVCWGRPAGGVTTAPQFTFQQLDCGLNFCCGIVGTGLGNARCWGRNDEGQATPPTDQEFIKISTSDSFHACGLTNENAVVCWGKGDPTSSTSPTAAPAHMLFTDVSAGAGYSCGVTFSGSLHCWGLGPTAPDLSWAAVEATTVHACGIKADRSLSCWGTETFDRIAHPEGGRYQMVDTSQLHSCALAYDGSIDCWGHEQFDQNIVPECP